MAEIMQNPNDIAQALTDIFTPAYEGWTGWEEANPALKEEASGRKAALILENDVKQLGLFIISIDDRATRIELGLMVDVISHLRSGGDDAFTTHNQQVMAEQLGLHERKNASAGFKPPLDTLELPLSLRIALDWRKFGNPVDLNGLRETFEQFVHRLILQDGNVTGEEIAVAGEVENVLRKLTA